MTPETGLAFDIETYLQRTYQLTPRAAELLRQVIHERSRDATIGDPEFKEFCLAWAKWTKWVGI
jgi:hypothetical protein